MKEQIGTARTVEQRITVQYFKNVQAWLIQGKYSSKSDVKENTARYTIYKDVCSKMDIKDCAVMYSDCNKGARANGQHGWM